MQLATFRKGIHPLYHKTLTSAKPIETLPMPDMLEIPVQQHLGAPPKLLKKRGDTVESGELIAEASGFISANVHSPVFGEVKRVTPRPLPGGRMGEWIEIAVDKEKTAAHAWVRREIDLSSLGRDGILSRIKAAGVVGMGGATFPTNVKFSPPAGSEVDTLVINGAECEPYLTCDQRLMVENARGILDGARVAHAALGFKTIVFGIEENKPDAVASVSQALEEFPELPARVVTLKVKYPQGAEKMLVHASTGRVVPAGSLPLDVGVVVSNVGTLLAIGEAIFLNKPLIERVLTVSGEGIREPKNLRVLLGTPVPSLIDYCGGFSDETSKVLFGGPMMGVALPSLEYSVMKGTSGVLFLGTAEVPDEGPCIRCGRCVEACPMNLMPLRIAAFAKAERFEEAKAAGVNDCFECGSCAWGCPAKIRLVSWMRYAKNYIRVHKI